jgi:hypothetical protein
LGTNVIRPALVDHAQQLRRQLQHEHPPMGQAVHRFAESATRFVLEVPPDLTADLQECFEGGDFIAHAAQARNKGMTRAAFLDRLVADVHLIQAFPPELRWFVQDQDDEELLTSAARLVFDSPREPQSHQSEFLAACSARVGNSTDTHAGLPAMSPAAAVETELSDR